VIEIERAREETFDRRTVGRATERERAAMFGEEEHLLEREQLHLHVEPRAARRTHRGGLAAQHARQALVAR
jgi:hypothetical protein